MHITLEGLEPGKWRLLTGEERAQLFHAVGRGSSVGDAKRE
jgi:hypothetical protein